MAVSSGPVFAVLSECVCVRTPVQVSRGAVLSWVGVGHRAFDLTLQEGGYEPFCSAIPLFQSFVVEVSYSFCP